MKEYTRREALELLLAGAIATFTPGYVTHGFCQEASNFRHIYLNPRLRDQFFLFLQNVFNLYPESGLHELINRKTMELHTDREIYQAILTELPTVKPILSEIRYALPSLKKQKEIMCQQTVELLDGRKKINGYLEIGTTGRYFDRLSDYISLEGTPVFIHSAAPTYGAADIVERGQIRKIGNFVPLADYTPIDSAKVPDESLDLMTVYIGFHHAAEERRVAFLQSCHRALRKNGMLIVRDHDVASADMVHFVALAHDVFNAGIELPWQDNEVEVRNFLSLAELEKLLIGVGFQSDDRRLLQQGDPTQNTLMKFVKV